MFYPYKRYDKIIPEDTVVVSYDIPAKKLRLHLPGERDLFFLRRRLRVAQLDSREREGVKVILSEARVRRERKDLLLRLVLADGDPVSDFARVLIIFNYEGRKELFSPFTGLVARLRKARKEVMKGEA